jgi:hypothetical protein
MVLDAGVEKASARGDQADTLHRVNERVVCVREVHVVVNLLQCALARHTVLEFKRADARLDFGSVVMDGGIPPVPCACAGWAALPVKTVMATAPVNAAVLNMRLVVLIVSLIVAC